MTRTHALASLLLVATGLPVSADVYMWVDEEGIVHYQDSPPAGQRGVKRMATPEAERTDPSPPGGADGRAPATSSDRAAVPATPVAVPTAPSRAPSTPSVELYTTSWCPWCKKARAFFSSRGISFTEYDIEKDPGALRRKVGLDGDTRVPTAVIDRKVIKGYSPEQYRAALGQR